MAYAEETKVPVARSRDHIEHELAKYGATSFGYLQEGARVVVMFAIGGRRVLIELPMPNGYASQREQEQATRARWRALYMVIKAKLVAVDAGISTIEREFLADIALPNGQTVGRWAAPQLEVAYAEGHMPALMPGVSDAHT